MPEYETVYGQITIRADEKEHYHDRWERAVQRRIVLAVYLPRDYDQDDYGSHLRHIHRGSGIVGSAGPGPEQVTIDFEGNLYDSVNMRSWAERVHHAAGRHVSVYPTVARAVQYKSWLRQIGTYEVATTRIHLEDQDAVRAWIGDEEFAELAITEQGTVLTDAAFNKLADEAERGYDVSKIRRRER